MNVVKGATRVGHITHYECVSVYVYIWHWWNEIVKMILRLNLFNLIISKW